MFSLDKLPLPLQELLKSLPALQVLKAVTILTGIKDMKVEDVPTQAFNDLLATLSIEDGGHALKVLTSHMATRPGTTLMDWFASAAEDGVFEKALSPDPAHFLHRCYFCGQPNEINLTT